MPSLAFSPLSFSSTASSRTMLRKTCHTQGQLLELIGHRQETYIVSTKNANDLAASVELDEQPLVEVLLGVSIPELDQAEGVARE